MSDTIDTGHAADLLGISRGRVRQLIDSGILAARKVDGRWRVETSSLAKAERRNRKVGRPGKGKGNNG